MAVSSWQWLWDFEHEARRHRDGARVRLATLYMQAERLSHDEPDGKIAVYEAGRELAKQLGERWCEMFYEHWVIEVLLFGKHDPRRALDHAARAVFETSKPEFAAFPQRLDLQMNLASAYMGIDPIGYQSELRAVLAHIEAGCGEFDDARVYYCQLQGFFLEQIEAAGALDGAYRYLQAAESQGDDHYLWDALSLLCTTSVRCDAANARANLADWAQLGEEAAMRENRNRGVAEFLMWRALAARWNGDEAQAKRFYRRAMSLQSRVAPPRNPAMLPAMEFHLAGGELEAALRVCQAEARIVHSHKLDFLLARCRLKKCKLLGQLGRDFTQEARRLRRLAAGLKSRAHWEAELEALEALRGNAG